jgi:hypothetical protein
VAVPADAIAEASQAAARTAGIFFNCLSLKRSKPGQRHCGATSVTSAKRLSAGVARADSVNCNGSSFNELNSRRSSALSRRDAPELCKKPSAPKRAWGMPGAQCTRSLVCE